VDRLYAHTRLCGRWYLNTSSLPPGSRHRQHASVMHPSDASMMCSLQGVSIRCPHVLDQSGHGGAQASHWAGGYLRADGWVGALLYLSAHTFQSAVNRILAKIGSADRAAAIQHARGDDIDMDRRGTLTVRCRLPPADLRLPFSCWGRPRER
jgi:hypothetical protein